MGKVKIILASASPRRRELLEQLGIEFDVLPSDVPERPLSGESPEAHVLRLAEDKARAAVDKVSEESWIIGSDTVVIIDGEILGKPLDDANAVMMLKKLSGQEHKVITAYCIINSKSLETVKKSVETAVKFKILGNKEISGYVVSGEPMDKAGAYAIQGLGSFMVEEIRGSYSNVVGLPVCQVVEDLEKLGAVSLF